LILGGLFLSSPAFASTESIFPDGSHCVAYKVEKTILFVSSSNVIGKNCDVSAQVLPEVGGLYRVEVNVPVRSFDSGETDRDKDVMHILKADEHPDLTFKTQPMSADAWHELFSKTDFDLDGDLSIGDKTFPLKMKMHYIDKDDEAEVQGSGHVRFQDLGLKPPSVGAGLFVQAKSDIELQFHLQSRRILGADSIRLIKEEK
jgi:polyisoprenoid-binding protein YceI